MTQMKEQIQSSKNRINDEEIANVSDAQLKTLIIKILTEIVEYGCKIEGKVKPMKREIRKIYREKTVKGRKPGLKSTI